MAARVVTGTLVRANGSAWSAVVVTFRLERFSYTATETHPISFASATTDEDGAFSVTLSAGLPSRYQVSMPDRSVWSIYVPEGPPTTLEALLIAAATPPDPPDLDALIDAITDAVAIEAHMVAPNPHTGSQPLLGFSPQHMFNVLDYGAVGDGVTADTAAFVAAITAGDGIDRVYVPGGTYLADADISWTTDEVHLQGAGIGVSILKREDPTAHTLNFGGNRSSVRDLTVDGSGTASVGGAHAIRFYGKYHKVQHCEIHDSKDYSLGMGQQTGQTLWNSVVDDVLIRNARNDAIDIKNRSDDNRTQFFSSIVIDGYDKDVVGGKSGIDMRGPCVVSGIEVRGTSANGTAVDFESGGVNGLGADGSSLVNAVIIGENSAQHKGITYSSTRINVANTDIDQCPRGISIQESDGAAVNTTVQNASTSGYQIIGDRARLTNTRAIGCTIGYDITGDDVTLVNGTAKDSTSKGVLVQAAAARAKLIGMTFVGTVGTALQIDAGAVGTLVMGCDFTGVSGTKLVDNGTGTVIIDCPGLTDVGRDQPLIYTMDGAGVPITIGAKGFIGPLGYAAKVKGWALTADVAATVTMDLWKDTLVNHPPTNADSITASAKPALTAAAQNSSTMLTGWNIDIGATDIIRYEVEANNNATLLTMQLAIARTH